MNQENTRNRRQNMPIPTEDREKLSELLDKYGETRVREAVGLSRMAFYRAVAGLPVYPGTRAMIREAIATRTVQT